MVDLEKSPAKTEFVEVPTRKFLTIKVNVVDQVTDPTETVVNRVMKASITDAVVKVVIECSEQKAHEIREMPIREALEGAYFIAGIVKEVRRADRIATENGYSDELATSQPLEALDLYFRDKDYPKEKIEKLREKAAELLEGIHDS